MEKVSFEGMLLLEQIPDRALRTSGRPDEFNVKLRYDHTIIMRDLDVDGTYIDTCC